MRRAHQHDCSSCGEPYDCAGLPEYNHDPDEVRCSYRAENTECEDCFNAPACGWCGAKNVPLTEVQFDGHRYCVEGSACDLERLEDATKALDDIGPAPTPAAKGRA